MSEENTQAPVRRRRSQRRNDPEAEPQAAPIIPPEETEEPVQYTVGNLNRGNARFGESQRMTASQPQVVLPPQYDPYVSVTGAQAWVPGEDSAAQTPWVSGAQPVYGWQNQFRSGTQPGVPVYPQGQAPVYPQGQIPVYPQGQAPTVPKGSRRDPAHRSHLPAILLSAAGGTILLVLLALLFLKWIPAQRAAEEARRLQLMREEQVALYNDKYCPGVFVDNIDLGGKTQEEARALVTDAANDSSAWYVQLIWEGEVFRTLTEADLGITVDVESALAQAWRQGHEGDTEARWSAMERLSTPEGAYHGTSVTDSGDTSALESSLTSVAASLYVAPVDAEFVMFDPFRTDPMIFREEVPGYYLDIDGLRNEALRMAKDGQSGSIELTASVLMPAVTVESLRAERYSLRGSASTPIAPTNSTEERNNNIRRAFELISGTVIQPGKQFDFNKIVGKRTLENGFFQAEEYVSGRHEVGIGGGVCQACTTIYQAAVRANMRIDKRTPHGLPVNYTPFGKDATVYWFDGKGGSKIDFVFTNTTDYPVYIKAAVQSSDKNKKRLVCNVWIYGPALGDGVTYDIETEEIVIPAPEEPKIVRDKNVRFVTYDDEQYVYQEAEDGTEVKRWLVRYVNKKEAERTQLETDIYPAKEQIIYVGTKKRPDT